MHSDTLHSEKTGSANIYLGRLPCESTLSTAKSLHKTEAPSYNIGAISRALSGGALDQVVFDKVGTSFDTIRCEFIQTAIEVVVVWIPPAVFDANKTL